MKYVTLLLCLLVFAGCEKTQQERHQNGQLSVEKTVKKGELHGLYRPIKGELDVG